MSIITGDYRNLPGLANKITEHPVKFEFQIFFFSTRTTQLLNKTYLC